MMTTKMTSAGVRFILAAGMIGLVLLTVTIFLKSSVQADSHGDPLTGITLSAGVSGKIETFTSFDLTPTFSSSTYSYTVAVEHDDNGLTIDATTGTDYEKELWRYTQHASNESGYLLRDLTSSIDGHQTKLKYGTTNLRYYVSTDLSSSDRTAHPLYSYNIYVTRPYPPLKISASRSSCSSWSHVENRNQLLCWFGAYGPGRDVDDQTWSLTGDDSGDFTLTRYGTSDRPYALRFNEAPDYESPADADTNNIYHVTINVSEDDETDTYDVTATVTDVASDDGTPVHWFSVWDGSVDDDPLDPEATLEVTEGETLSISVRPSYAPLYEGATRVGSETTFDVNIDIGDESKLVISGPETVLNNNGKVLWSSAGNGWQVYKTVRFTAQEDSDSQDESVTLDFQDQDGKYGHEFMTFTVNVTDDDEIGGL